MQPPPIPADERERLASLRALNILDTPPEERFDRVTRLARRLFDVPIALVSLVDGERQWFKSRAGLDTAETPRDISFCGHAVLDEQVLLVRDATVDVRFRDNPLVSGEPRIRFYAGCPMHAGDGRRVGTLCVIDQRPRELDEAGRSLLRELARMAESELAGAAAETTDPLTLLSSRRGFECLAAHSLELGRRSYRPVSLVCFEVTGPRGPRGRLAAGVRDLVLRGFADVLRGVFCNGDVLGRVGEQEFAVLLVGDTSSDNLGGILRRFETSLAHRNGGAGEPRPIRYRSVALAFDAGRHADVSALLAAAEQSMAELKRVPPGILSRRAE